MNLLHRFAVATVLALGALLSFSVYADILTGRIVGISDGDTVTPPETNVKFSMTYRNAASLPHAGELGEGGSVDVKKNGTIFNVTRTVQS